MNNEQTKPHTIEYVINYTGLVKNTEPLAAFKERIEEFAPQYLRHVPFATVGVPREREQELLTTLASIDAITYHVAEPRRAFDTIEKSIDDTIEEP